MSIGYRKNFSPLAHLSVGASCAHWPFVAWINEQTARWQPLRVSQLRLTRATASSRSIRDACASAEMTRLVQLHTSSSSSSSSVSISISISINRPSKYWRSRCDAGKQSRFWQRPALDVVYYTRILYRRVGAWAYMRQDSTTVGILYHCSLYGQQLRDSWFIDKVLA